MCYGDLVKRAVREAAGDAYLCAGHLGNSNSARERRRLLALSNVLYASFVVAQDVNLTTPVLTAFAISLSCFLSLAILQLENVAGSKYTLMSSAAQDR